METSTKLKESITLSTGAQMPIIGFGTYKCKSVESIETAIVEVGYRHIDTATLYENEEQVG